MKNSKNKSYFKNIAQLASGNSIAQLVIVVANLALIRIYTPNHFGYLALFLGITSIVSSFGTLSLHHAIVAAKKNTEAIALTKVISFSATITSLTLLTALLIYYQLAKNPLTIAFSILATLTVFMNCKWYSLTNWSNRFKSYPLMARSAIIQSASSTGFSIASSFFIKTEYNMIIGYILGQFLCITSFTIGLNKYKTFNIQNILPSLTIDTNSIGIVRKYIKFIKYDLPYDLAQTGSTQIPNILLAKLYSTELAGLYNIAQRICTLPLTLFGNAVHQIFFKLSADEEHNIDYLREIAIKTVRTIFLITAPSYIILSFYGSEIFTFVFGIDWKMSGQITSILCISYIFQISIYPILGITKATKSQELLLKHHSINISSRIFIITGCYLLSFNINTIAIALSVCTILIWPASYQLILTSKLKSRLTWLETLTIPIGILLAFTAYISAN